MLVLRLAWHLKYHPNHVSFFSFALSSQRVNQLDKGLHTLPGDPTPLSLPPPSSHGHSLSLSLSRFLSLAHMASQQHQSAAVHRRVRRIALGRDGKTLCAPVLLFHMRFCVRDFCLSYVCDKELFDLFLTSIEHLTRNVFPIHQCNPLFIIFFIHVIRNALFAVDLPSHWFFFCCVKNTVAYLV